MFYPYALPPGSYTGYSYSQAQPVFNHHLIPLKESPYHLTQHQAFSHRSSRQMEPLDPSMFMDSATDGQLFLQEANAILNKITTDREFARQVMTAARESDYQEVERLIMETGITRRPRIWFNPDGIRFEFQSSPEQVYKSSLSMAVKWQQFMG
ncbi:hypothetical protein K8O68_06490 [Salipaludibacillus sp. CUR1]|uniref:hypothetical protein n=1 Tax=Salipaludibacillus sp. CUR1 TaxID=2820003 RepID=UPI001E54D2CE|nr:hypothetical protein [Salipaludibacillus sp. CUR1]MCE7792069.1 hypothetical protein [Salipaludibacillus sp. CUR1]